MGKLSPLALVSAAALACACSSNPPPEEPKQETTAQLEIPEPPPEPTADPGPANDVIERPHGAKAIDDQDRSVPDDYALMEGDCVQLGRKLGALWRVELRASLSPKLTEKQREKAEESIEEGASKKEDSWAEGCIKSLVGKSVDPKSLKCAFDAKDLKAFEKCLN